MLKQIFVLASSGLLALLVSTAGCSSTPTSTPGSNGVDDVTKACEIRATWTHATSTACSSCYSYATTPRCDCTDLDYAGKCSGQQKTKVDEPSCADVDTCIRACTSTTDCACVDACYTNKAACRKAASAVDGCVAETCDEHCR